MLGHGGELDLRQRGQRMVRRHERALALHANRPQAHAGARRGGARHADLDVAFPHGAHDLGGGQDLGRDLEVRMAAVQGLDEPWHGLVAGARAVGQPQPSRFAAADAPRRLPHVLE